MDITKIKTVSSTVKKYTRMREVFEMKKDGLKNKHIAEKLGVSTSTVKRDNSNYKIIKNMEI